jgi:hypothetical protein
MAAGMLVRAMLPLQVDATIRPDVPYETLEPGLAQKFVVRSGGSILDVGTRRRD